MTNRFGAFLIGLGSSMNGWGIVCGFESKRWNLWLPYVVIAVAIASVGIYIFIRSA